MSLAWEEEKVSSNTLECGCFVGNKTLRNGEPFECGCRRLWFHDRGWVYELVVIIRCFKCGYTWVPADKGLSALTRCTGGEIQRTTRAEYHTYEGVCWLCEDDEGSLPPNSNRGVN